MQSLALAACPGNRAGYRIVAPARRSRDQIKEALNEAEAAKIRAESATAEAVSQRKVAEAQKSRAEKALYISRIRSADENWERGHIVEAWRNLDAAQWDLRGWEHDYLYSKFTLGQATRRGHKGPVSSVGFSPDGTRIVSGSDDKTVEVWDASSRQPASVPDSDSHPSGPL